MTYAPTHVYSYFFFFFANFKFISVSLIRLVGLLDSYFVDLGTGGKEWLGFPDLWSGQKPWWNWYLTPVVNFDEVRGAKLAKSTLLTSSLVPLGLFRSFKVCPDGKEREWGAESNGKLPHLFTPSKTATLVSKFAGEDLPLDRTAVLGPEFAMKDLPLGRTLWWWLRSTYLEYTLLLLLIYVLGRQHFRSLAPVMSDFW